MMLQGALPCLCATRGCWPRGIPVCRHRLRRRASHRVQGHGRSGAWRDPHRCRSAYRRPARLTGGRVAERIAGAGQVAGGDVPGGMGGERVAERAFDGGVEAIRDHANGDARAIVERADGGGHVERGDALRRGLADVVMRPAHERDGIHARQARGVGGGVERQTDAEDAAHALGGVVAREDLRAERRQPRADGIRRDAVPSRVTSAITVRAAASVWTAALCGKRRSRAACRSASEKRAGLGAMPGDELAQTRAEVGREHERHSTHPGRARATDSKEPAAAGWGRGVSWQRRMVHLCRANRAPRSSDIPVVGQRAPLSRDRTMIPENEKDGCNRQTKRYHAATGPVALQPLKTTRCTRTSGRPSSARRYGFPARSCPRWKNARRTGSGRCSGAATRHTARRRSPSA